MSEAERRAGKRDDASISLFPYKWIERKAIQRCTEQEIAAKREVIAMLTAIARKQEGEFQGMPANLPPQELPGVHVLWPNGMKVRQRPMIVETLPEFTERTA